MWTFFHKLGSPPHFYRLAGKLTPWFGWIAAVLLIGGLYGGLFLAPADRLQGEGFRIIYVHVPSAYMSMFVYVVMAVAAGIGLIWRMKLAHAVAAACAPLGASFTFLALVTGSLWGKPMWGTYWVWDARLTSELLLLFLYLGYMALRASFAETSRADRASAVLALVGVVNIPIIHYSVKWWNTLHQGETVIPTLTNPDEPVIAMTMLVPLLMMITGFTCYFAAVLFIRVRGEVLARARNTAWVKEAI